MLIFHIYDWVIALHNYHYALETDCMTAIDEFSVPKSVLKEYGHPIFMNNNYIILS